MKLKVFISTLALVASIFYVQPANAVDGLTGSGSTFAANYIDSCKVKYAKTTGVSITYSPIGSGSGRNSFNNKLTDFALSDVPYAASDVKPKEEFVYVPIVAGPVAIVYNLKGYAPRLKLSKEVLAKIFAGQITMWNDPQIVALNKVGKLPKTKIVVGYRADGSGTSEVFTSYLNTIAPKIWTKPGNKSFASAFPGTIPAGYFQSASGSFGIANLQSMTNGSISYNELSFTRSLKNALIENEAGMYMAPTPNSAAAFLGKLTFNPEGTAILNYKNTSKTSYNISTFTYAIVYKDGGERSQAIREFLTFSLSNCKHPDYAPITGNALKVAKEQLAKIK
jgi:phosphate transport system substrate-binding protein